MGSRRWEDVRDDHAPANPTLDAEAEAWLSEALGTSTAAPAPAGRVTAEQPAMAASPLGATGPTAAPRADDDGRVAAGQTTLASLLQAAIEADASDLHLCAGLPPHVRTAGALRPLAGHPPFGADELDRLLQAALTPAQRARLDACGDLDLGMALGKGVDAQRVRGAVFVETGSLSAAFRVIPNVVPDLAELGLPAVVDRLADLPRGLVLVTGQTGSGKSTTLAAMVSKINRQRSAHIITVEDPIEYRHAPVRSVIQQREVGADTESFAAAIRHALRQDPDVILIGELRDLETIRTALTAAETGHLVLATLHSSDATSAVNRVIDVFPGDQQSQIRSQLALSLQGSISQHLVPSLQGGRVVATEVMTSNSAVRNLVRDDKVHLLRGVLETSSDDGMHTLDQSLASLVRQRRIDADHARRLVHDAGTFDELVRR